MELQEDGQKNETVQHQPLSNSKSCQQVNGVGKLPFAVLSIALLLILVILLILQGVTLAQLQLNILPVVCPETSTSTTASTDTLISENNSSAPDTCNKELLTQIIQLINVSHDEQMEYTLNNTEILQQLLETIQASGTQLASIIATLSTLELNGVSTEAVINNIQVLIEVLLQLQNWSVLFNSHLPISCEDIKNKQPSSPTGYYHVNSRLIYCNMDEMCGIEGGWTRLAYLDMSDSTMSCPSGFRLYETGGFRACGRPVGGPSCASITFPSNNISYSEVCGRVVGYQYASPDAVDTRFISDILHNDINSYYVDGVSITCGYPRQHIWTLMAGVIASYYDAGNCPCNTPPGSTQDIQSFIGNDYFCESGNPANGYTNKLYTDDPLWDGQGCGSQEGNCCAAPGLPWFYKTFNSTTDYIELRECGDQSTNDEDVPISLYEIYIK